MGDWTTYDGEEGGEYEEIDDDDRYQGANICFVPQFIVYTYFHTPLLLYTHAFVTFYCSAHPACLCAGC